MTEEKHINKALETIRNEAMDFSNDKISSTLKEVFELLQDISELLIVDGVLRKVRWYNIMEWWKMANLLYHFAVRIIEIWKK